MFIWRIEIAWEREREREREREQPLTVDGGGTTIYLSILAVPEEGGES